MKIYESMEIQSYKTGPNNGLNWGSGLEIDSIWGPIIKDRKKSPQS